MSEIFVLDLGLFLQMGKSLYNMLELFSQMGKGLCNILEACFRLLSYLLLSSIIHPHTSKSTEPLKMAPKVSLASLAPKSPPKTRRSIRKRAQSSADDTTQPPAKKVAISEAEGGKESGDEGGKNKKARKGTRYGNYSLNL